MRKSLLYLAVLRCGYFVFSTGANDPFIPCCVKHDKEYDLKDKGKQIYTRKYVDRLFYNCMLNVAGDSRILKIKAKLYYGIARTLGILFW